MFTYNPYIAEVTQTTQFKNSHCLGFFYYGVQLPWWPMIVRMSPCFALSSEAAHWSLHWLYDDEIQLFTLSHADYLLSRPSSSHPTDIWCHCRRYVPTKECNLSCDWLQFKRRQWTQPQRLRAENTVQDFDNLLYLLCFFFFYHFILFLSNLARWLITIFSVLWQTQNTYLILLYTDFKLC